MVQQQKNLLEYWKAYLYEHQEEKNDAITCMQQLIGNPPLRILDIGCGSARLGASLAQAGHDVTGIDCSSAMLHFALEKAKKLPNLHIQNADAFVEPWGNNYDAVILGDNLICNLITEWDYKQAQKQLIHRAGNALRPGGKLILDFDCPDRLSIYEAEHNQKPCLKGTDDRGNTGRHFVFGSLINEKTRNVRFTSRTEILPSKGNPFRATSNDIRHFPTLSEMCAWLYREGFSIELIHGGHHGEPFDLKHRRAVILARKDESTFVP